MDLTRDIVSAIYHLLVGLSQTFWAIWVILLAFELTFSQKVRWAFRMLLRAMLHPSADKGDTWTKEDL